MALVLAGLVPLVVYAFTASGHSYWLDSAEFTAAAVDLDIAHPPGHPVASLWGRALCFLPLGPLPYRVALAQGLAAAIGAAALQAAFARTLARLEVKERAVRAALSLSMTWALAFSYGYWFQAVRAEVYALQTMLICLALERLVAMATDDELRDVRPLYAASFYLGLGLANHHFMSVLALPAMLHGLLRAIRKFGTRSLLWTFTSGAVGLVSYLYLPLRAAREPTMDLGHPVTLDSLWWVVSAQVYARRIGSEATQPMGERFADLLVILSEQFSAAAFFLALLGLYLLIRTRALWPLLSVWGVTALVTLCGRAWLNPVRANPDVLGYMLPGFAAYLALAACAVVVLLRAIANERRKRQATLSFAVLGLGLALLQLTQTYQAASLADFHATDEFDLLREAVPARAVLVLTHPETTFRHFEGAAVSRARPDVAMLPLPFVNYGDSAQVLMRRHPELREVVQSYQRSHEELLSHAPLLALARERPVLVEADLKASWGLFTHMLPEGLFYRVLPAPPSRDAVRRATSARARTLAELSKNLGEERTRRETQSQLLWLYYMDALYLATHGEPELSLSSLREGLDLAPQERQLLALQAALVSDSASFRLLDYVPSR